MDSRTSKSLLIALLFSGIFLLTGCVSTLPETGGTKINDPEAYEQRNLEIAFGFLQQGYPGRAIARLQEVLKVNSRSSRAYGMLGVIYQSQKEYELSKENFIKALSIDSDASDIRLNYGGLLYAMERYDDAREELEAVTEDIYYENRSRAFENLGFVALKQNDKAMAKEHFERALRLDRRLPNASIELTQIYYDDGNLVSAERYFRVYEEITRNSRPTARSLWLGIELSRAFDQSKQLRLYAQQLRRYYPGSQEYRQYQASLRNE